MRQNRSVQVFAADVRSRATDFRFKGVG